MPLASKTSKPIEDMDKAKLAFWIDMGRALLRFDTVKSFYLGSSDCATHPVVSFVTTDNGRPQMKAFDTFESAKSYYKRLLSKIEVFE